jgi:anti-sigma factor RsiW
MREDIHPSREELLLCADGELPSREVASVRKHLSACWQCRTLMGEIELSIAEFTQSYRIGDASIPPIEGPKALLKARLSEARPPQNGWSKIRWWPRTHRWPVRRLMPRWISAATLATLTIGFGVFIGLEFRAFRRSHADAGYQTVITPRQSLTPGAVRLVTRDEVCSANVGESARIVPASLKRKVFEEYGMPQANPDAYEVDYLITPELGGAPDIRNLWPESYFSTEWNAHVKDELEQRLHEMVCTGEIDLATAQHDIAVDWVSAYKKYFHRDRPF